MSRELVIRTNCRASVRETWTLTVPDDFEMDMDEDWSNLLDHPEAYGAAVVSAVNTDVWDEDDRELEGFEIEDSDPVLAALAASNPCTGSITCTADTHVASCTRNLLGLYPPDEDYHDTWNVIGDLRASDWDEANHDCADAMRARYAPQIRGELRTVDVDPEFSCFYAYCKTKEIAVEVAAAVTDWVAQHRKDTK